MSENGFSMTQATPDKTSEVDWATRAQARRPYHKGDPERRNG